jgi:hypothetical protein
MVELMWGMHDSECRMIQRQLYWLGNARLSNLGLDDELDIFSVFGLLDRNLSRAMWVKSP